MSLVTLMTIDGSAQEQRHYRRQDGQTQAQADAVDVIVAVIAVIALALGAVPHDLAGQVLVRAALPAQVLMAGYAHDVIAAGGFLQPTAAVRARLGVGLQGSFRFGDPPALIIGRLEVLFQRRSCEWTTKVARTTAQIISHFLKELSFKYSTGHKKGLARMAILMGTTLR
jgi:hypothetical protein